MRSFLIFIALCMALTVLRTALAVLLIALALSLVWGVFFRPAETFGFIALLLFGAVLQTHTIAVLLVIGFLGFIVLVRQSPESSDDCAEESPLLLMDSTRDVGSTDAS